MDPLSAKGKPFGRLIAWDPVAQKEAWRVEHVSPWNGGTVTTAGNLVFEGTADARFVAYNAKTGEKLWEAPTGTGAMAGPIAYEIDGKQYVSVAAGWGGVYGQVFRHSDRVGPGTVYTFALGGKAKAPEFVQLQQAELVSGVKYDPAKVEAGTALYVNNCVFCHGVPGVWRGGSLPNLGYMPATYIENLQKFVFKGPAIFAFMLDFTGGSRLRTSTRSRRLSKVQRMQYGPRSRWAAGGRLAILPAALPVPPGRSGELDPPSALRG